MTKLSIFIDDSGLEALATGNELYYWAFSVRREEDSPPKNSFKVAESIEFTPPSKEVATRIAVEVLREKKNQIYVDAAREAAEVDVRINNLLAIEGPSA